MQCPHCNKPITNLGVVVQATLTFSPQIGYSSIEDIEDTLSYYCLDCGTTLPFKEADQMVYEASEKLYKGGEEDVTRYE